MHLVSAVVGPFKSISEPQRVVIDPEVTVLVGMNEAGKTVFLQALEKSRDILNVAEFDLTPDYPRRLVSAYRKKHETNPDIAVRLTFRPSNTEINDLNADLGTTIPVGWTFDTIHDYSNKWACDLAIDEEPVIRKTLSDTRWSTDAKNRIKTAATIREIPVVLEDQSLSESDQEALAEINARITASGTTSVVNHEAWTWLQDRCPKFLYFSDYDLIQSKTNIPTLLARASKPRRQDRAVMALLRMADITIEELANPIGYEALKSKLESVRIDLTDKIMSFWKQNQHLEVEIDIHADPTDDAPFHSGSNLYLRIKNTRHRGVTTPFDHRSRGFVWFFSFLVWFDQVHHQIEAGETALPILLLDEPGINLHAMAQADFLEYIDTLAQRHQVIFTTHSPFMVDSNRLDRVRVVEDVDAKGTVISQNLGGSSDRTIFPLQAALGWTLAQNLFISERNLLVEGPSELIYLKSLSETLESQGRTSLRSDVTIVPVGGMDKVATFVALLGANGLKLAVLHDYNGAADQRLMDLTRQKMLSSKNVLNASQFRDLSAIGKDGKPSDIEDLFSAVEYLGWFSAAFSKVLKREVHESDLPPASRIVHRLERYIEINQLTLRPSGGFNHFTVASHFASHPPDKVDNETLDRFEALFKTINAIF